MEKQETGSQKEEKGGAFEHKKLHHRGEDSVSTSKPNDNSLRLIAVVVVFKLF